MDQTNASQTAAPQFNPYFALVSGVLAVSTGAIFARLADAPSLVIAAYRVGLATLLLTPLAWIKARNELLNLSPRELKLAAVSGLFLAFHFATWISSLEFTSVANSVVLVNTNPLWVGLLTPLLTRERIKAAVAMSIIISVVGGIIIGAGDFAIGGRALLGDFKLSLLAYIYVCYGCAALFLWLIVLGFRLQISGFSTNTYATFWAMAIITQLIGHSSYNWALKWFSATLIAISLLGEPIGSTILAYIIFNEGLTGSKVIGGVLILSAICISAASENRTR
jgi:drug/metabolite transporter (DMT)-like permease